MSGLPGAAPPIGNSRTTHVVAVLGVVLLLGGFGHAAGVTRLYMTTGVPDANRIMLDLWVAEAQLLGGGLFLAAFEARGEGSPGERISDRPAECRSIERLQQ